MTDASAGGWGILPDASVVLTLYVLSSIVLKLVSRLATSECFKAGLADKGMDVVRAGGILGECSLCGWVMVFKCGVDEVSSSLGS